jgi:hypothetical protein
MTQKDIINEAWAQLPNPNTYIPYEYNVDFNYKEGSCLMMVGSTPIDHWDVYKDIPIRISFKKVSGQWQIVEPFDGFDIEKYERENPQI